MIAGKQKTECGLWLGDKAFAGYMPDETATLDWEKVTCGGCRRFAEHTKPMGKSNEQG
jgi:hypothetical protein